MEESDYETGVPKRQKSREWAVPGVNSMADEVAVEIKLEEMPVSIILDLFYFWVG